MKKSRTPLERRIEPLEQRIAPATFLVTNINDAGSGSLRQAILDANSAAFPGLDTINFNIPGAGLHSIRPTSPLPVITDPVVIDGFSQPGASANSNGPGMVDNAVRLIELRPGFASGFATGLNITAGDSAVQGLIVTRWNGAGITLSGAGGNVIAGNLIGTDANGNNGAGNLAEGIKIVDSPNNAIGGAAPADRNRIVGNSADGISISGAAATGNIILGNLIGTDGTGVGIQGNTGHGVRITGGGNNTIGGTTPAERNVISGAQNGSGVMLQDTTGNVVAGNFIGTDVTGSLRVPNSNFGVFLVNASTNNIIGGTAPGAGNVIGANAFSGVLIGGSSGPSPGAATGNRVEGNFIGTNATGAVNLGNSFFGVSLNNNAANNIIGGSAPGAANVIAANFSGGISVQLDATAVGNKVLGNFIGTNAAGVNFLGNGGRGIAIASPMGAPAGLAIGGSGAGEGNVIAFNGGDGIIVDAPSRGVAILGNSIHDNNGLGIDLGTDGFTPNDAGDVDAGANDLQNFPVLTSVFPSGGNTTITGTLNSTPNTIFRIEFFTTDSVDGNGVGQGRTFFGSVDVPLDATGNASFNANIPSPLALGTLVTATATAAAGTSEFAVARAVANPPNTIVTTTLDVVNVNDGVVSLREAILFANSNPGPDTITFAIGQPGSVQTIQPLDQGTGESLPIITETVFLDGWSQGGPGYSGSPLIELDGSLSATSGFGTFGFNIQADNSVVRGFAINRFAAAGAVNGFGIGVFNASNVHIYGNYIGTGVTGTVALGNGRGGIWLGPGASGVRIGTNADGSLDAAERNIISGNGGSAGVLVHSNNNFISGNFIGTDATGTASLGNNAGVLLEIAAQNNSIGGFGSQGNLISGNLGAGVHLKDSSSGNSVDGNLIGTNATGTAALANQGSGVLLEGNSSNNFIGDNEEGGNTISGNRGDGIQIIGGSNDNRIRGNFIGTDPTGTIAIRNDGAGLRIQDASGNRIGGLGARDGNVISGNDGGGIRIAGSSTANIVQGNRIGTDIDGLVAIPNDRDGITLSAGAQGTDISRNVISGNFGDGIFVASGANANQMLGNYIGTDAQGTIALGNLGHGINIAGNDNFVGYSDFEAGNLISGNAQRGVFISGNGNVVRGSLIGTDSAGITAIGNGFDGLTIAAPGSNNIIGGDIPADRNVISGNDISGISIESLNDADGFASDNVVQGNFIGVAADGVTPLGNRAAGGQLGWGVVILRQATRNLIGGTAPGTANLIAFNDGPGVALVGDAAADNAIIGNSIVSNGGLGIDLGSDGVTVNDAGDGDLGPNTLLNHPVITGVLRSPIAGGGFDYAVTGTYSGAPNLTLTIELYANNSADPSGSGEGEAPVDRFVITTDANGAVTFNRTFTTAATNDFGSPIGAFVTSTATLFSGLSGPTSEFSPAVGASNPAGDIIVRNGAEAEGQKGDGTVTFRVRLTQAVTSPVSVHFATHDLVMPGAATVGEDYEFTEGDLTFAPGETEKLISVLVHGDRTPEARERFGITLSNPVGAGLPESEAVGSILDDDHHLLFAGQGLGSRVEIRNATTGNLVRSFLAFAPGFTGGVRVASGDVNGDGFNDIIAGAGDGGGTRIRVFDGHNLEHGRPVKLYDFRAYTSGYFGGVYVAAGDVNGDGHADIIVGRSASSVPEVRIFSGADGSFLTSFLGLEGSGGGVRVAAGDVNGDGYADIITGTGKGSRVGIFDGRDPSVLLDSFRSYPLVYDRGVSVASGDVNGDGLDDVIVGAAKASNLVRIFLAGEEGRAAEFAAYGGPLRGVNVGAVDINSDGIADIITSQGRGGDSKVRIYKGNSVLNDNPRAPIKFDAFGPDFLGGVFVG